MSQTVENVTMPEPIQANASFTQTVGGQVFEYNLKTTGRQVKMSDGVDLETRLQMVERAASGAAVVKFADTVADRDALAGLNPGDIVVVADATDDETVDVGGARYVKQPEGQGFKKISEDESLDFVPDWSLIENGPASTPADIDLAVARQHQHANYETLTHLSDDGSDQLLYKGRRINDGKVWCARVASLADIPTNLADGGIVILVAADDAGTDTGTDTGADAGA